jgi:predicted nucleic acid-binding protein
MTARVVDAGPLLFLARLDRLLLLCMAVDHVLVPSAVVMEIRRKPDPVLTKVDEALQAGWLVECADADPTVLTALPDVGEGERDVIAQAIARHLTSVVLDDMDARRAARSFNLQPIGTVGLLLAANREAFYPWYDQNCSD